MSHSEEQHSVSAEHEIRKEKVRELEASGVLAWPEARRVETTIQEAKDSFIADEDEERVMSVAGRIMSRRGHGKTVFAHIQDRTGRLQLYMKKDVLSEKQFVLLQSFIDIGDIVWCQGLMFTTKTGEVTLRVTEIVLLSKCLHPLPEKYHGLANVEQRYRQRYLDIMTNEESRKKFVQRSRIIERLRKTLLENDFLEVETPMMHAIPGGAAAKPFVTHHKAYDMDLFLRIAPELYLKRLVIGGFERVFEVNRNFRNEGVSTRHNPEFTMLEYYMAYGDYRDGMALTEQLFHAAAQCVSDNGIVRYGAHELDFSGAFTKMSLKQVLIEVGGFTEDVIMSAKIDGALRECGVAGAEKKAHGEKLLLLFEEVVESQLIQPIFITDYPIEASPLARQHENDPDRAARFELFVAGMEIANGFSELNNPFDQAERFKEQVCARDAGDDEAHCYDAEYVKALEYGLPPTTGVGIGIDRLVMLLTNTTSIKDVILFPTMKRLEQP